MNIILISLSAVLMWSCGDIKTKKDTVTESNTPTEEVAPEKVHIVEDDVQDHLAESIKFDESIDQKKEDSSIDYDKEQFSKDTTENSEMPEVIENTPETSTAAKVNEKEEEKTTVIEEIPEEVTEDVETEQVENIEKKMVKTIDHGPWNALLTKYVQNNGDVDYKGFAKDVAALNSYLTLLANNKPQDDWSKNEKLAFYINLYNAATVKLIVDNYPVKSIKNIKRPWGSKIVTLGDELISLGDVEHKILRKMNEPRIHFAINCASFSCPKLVNVAFTAQNMEQQLEAATKDFINDPTRNKIAAERAQLSEIFKWYKKDFITSNSATVLEYIDPYIDVSLQAKTKVDYLKYDWNLNEAK